MKHDSKILDFKWGYFFLILTIFNLLTTFVNYNFLYTDTYYINSLSNRLDIERIHELLTINRKFQWLIFILQPFLLFLKLAMITAVVFAGVLLFGETVKFKTLFKATIISEYVMVLAGMIKTLWLILTHADNIQLVNGFYPLSVLNFLENSRIPSYLLYPLQQLNLFEVAYWLILAFCLKQALRNTYRRSVSILASSYGVSFMIWIMVVVFLQIQFN